MVNAFNNVSPLVRVWSRMWSLQKYKKMQVSSEITKFAIYLSNIYGENLTVHRGKVHDYLGVDFNYSNKGKVKVSMIKYLKGVIE